MDAPVFGFITWPIGNFFPFQLSTYFVLINS